MSSHEHLYIVAYDIADQKRWRAIFKVMKGYGEWLQLSVFQCRLSDRRHAEMQALLDQLIHHEADHIVILDMGRADVVTPKVTSLGKSAFKAVERRAIVV
jgi:CRISPR-associated protein Cas2